MIPDSDPDLDRRKAALRAKLRQRRRAANAANGLAIAALAAERFLAAIPVRAGQVVAGYWPMEDELDPRPLMLALQQRGTILLLPGVATQKAQPLVFRRWDDISTTPPAGRFGIPAPPADAPVLMPDILIVPLVGFDGAGHRLGLGGGFYDATLAALRAAGDPVLAVGYAFAVQQVAELPSGPLDERLDWAVTERGALAFER
ncbi:5-formyltetrahydrofolate cyclo-ligase [Ferrovibrio sp.]|uniref:5-formyltetrahydrofolate cyclo-ligase n=1 Tax=Ferrovibrio sp. TaxID=1917215 RepID=UPI0026103130|nr:5-formyltetrahydrofolate cyclo-ligase [Ferrovibrio sp.]